MTLEERINADTFRAPRFREFGAADAHFVGESDKEVLIVLGVFVAIVVAAFACGWLCGRVGV